MDAEFDRLAAEYRELLKDPLRDAFAPNSDFFVARKLDVLVDYASASGLRTASATWRTSIRGSTAVVPFACGTPAVMRSVISVAALPISICPQAIRWCRPSSEMLFVRPVMACFVEV